MSDTQIAVPRHVYRSVERTLRVAQDRAARAAAKVDELQETFNRLVVKDRHQNSEDSEPTTEE